jgi:hypothetical protein
VLVLKIPGLKSLLGFPDLSSVSPAPTIVVKGRTREAPEIPAQVFSTKAAALGAASSAGKAAKSAKKRK